MRILIITNEDPGKQYGGAGEFVRQLKLNLQKMEVDARVLLIRYNIRGKKIESSPLVDYTLVQKKDFPAVSAEEKILRSSYNILSQALPILQEFNPDVVHCNDRQGYFPFRGMPNVLFALHFVQAELVGLSNLNDTWFQEYKIDRYALQNAAVSVVYSQFMRKRVWDVVAPGTSNMVLPLGGGRLIPGCDAKPRQQPKVISYFGRFEQRQKGIIDFLKAAYALANDPDIADGVELRVYGRGYVAPKYRYECLRWTGFVENEERDQAYQESDVVVMPSKYEPFGLVALEAMGAGCLVLAPQGQGMDEFFHPGINGVAIDSEPESIVRSVKMVLADWEAHTPMIRAAREEASHWTWARCAAAHKWVYQRITEGSHKNIQTACSPRYALLKKHSSWSDSQPKPGMTVAVVANILYLLSKDTKTLVWNPSQTEQEEFSRHNADFLYSNDSANVSLETLSLLTTACPQLIIISGFEFCLDPAAALRELNSIDIGNLVIGFYLGKRVPGQIATFDDPDFVKIQLAGYRCLRSKVVEDTIITQWSKRPAKIA